MHFRGLARFGQAVLLIFFVGSICTAPFAYSIEISNSQLRATQDAMRRNRTASNLARNAGRNSIGRGLRNIRHGKSHHHPPEVKMGAFQVAQGILGLLAAAAAAAMANKEDGSAANLDSLDGKNSGLEQNLGSAMKGDGGDLSGRGGSTGASLGSVSVAKLAEIDLKDPEIKDALAAIHDEFGIGAKQFVAALENGRDPRDLFVNAPENPMSSADAGAALLACSSGEREDASNVTATGEASAGRSLASVEGSVPNEAAPRVGEHEGLRDALAKRLSASDEEMDLSPDVRAALAKKAAAEKERAEREARSMMELNLFEVVHQKYQEREKNLRWGEPLGSRREPGA